MNLFRPVDYEVESQAQINRAHTQLCERNRHTSPHLEGGFTGFY